jgi:predicted protein tyrosine phosphatase
MSVIYICPLVDVHTHCASFGPSHVLSLLGNDPFPDTPPGMPTERHLRLRFHDIDEPMEGMTAPAAHHIEAILRFGLEWGGHGPAVVHCFAGVSRSTAAALTLVAQANPGHEAAAARLLRQRAPHAKPNRRMIRLADEALGLRGRLVDAVERMGTPDFATMGTLVELPARFA